jgi:hypothetical protein
MRELVLTDDPVLLSFVETLLGEAGIGNVVLDQSMSRLHGAAGRVMARIMVDDGDVARARRLLRDAGLEEWIVGTGE